ncbi:MAG: hypothetical protein P8P36_05720 [Akkermansiaceae bacterium]|nr:hypothetical protein [Akkermansiaceae bacterium]
MHRGRSQPEAIILPYVKVPKQPASFLSGDTPQQDPPPTQETIGSESAITPFSGLSSSRENWSNSLESMPAFPSSAHNQGEGSRSNSHANATSENLAASTTLPSLPTLPTLPIMASHVSRSLLDQEGHARGNTLTELPPLPSEAPPIRLSPSGNNNHNWEPHLPRPSSKETESTTHDLPDTSSPFTEKPTPPLTAEASPENSDHSSSEDPVSDATKSPLIRAGLLDKIKYNKPPHRTNPGESPFSAITTVTADSSQPTETETVESPAKDNPAPNTSTPFAETEHKDSKTRAQSKFTDKDLQDALRPLVGASSDPSFKFPSNTNNFLEPMLRSTVRRAIAEQMAEASPFRDVPGWNKLAWKLRALMSSRTYDDILFDQTRRYQVEEVFLLRPQTRSLISYASNNPARHAKSSKVEGTVKKIATKTAAIANHQTSVLDWRDDRKLVIRPGRHSMLAAIVHGSPNHVLEADLDYLLSQVEERLGKSLEDSHQAHLQILQPMLECCLLIQSLTTSN